MDYSRTSLKAALLLLAITGCNRMTVQTEERTAVNRVLQPIGDLLAEARVRAVGKEPSHHRLWRPDLAVLPYAEIDSHRVYLHNIRDCEYRSEEDYDVRHFDRQVALEDVRSVDFIVVPFKETPALAHTMLSFGLADGQYLVFSVEARLEQGESYALISGTTNEFELMWIVGTERDLIRLRTEVRNVDVYLYRTSVTPEQAQQTFLAAVARVNEIFRTPEFYDALNNNCTTNIVDMVNRLRPGSVPQDIRVMLPGHSDKLAYELGLLAAPGPFEQIKRASRINTLARIHADSSNFSQAIRGL
ncbi:MAG: DUF4105 domain-containing protein [Pirellulaceae bacterium]